MQIRRFKDIVAVKHDTSGTAKSGIVAFHASNLEVAEVSEEAFLEMTPISLSTGQIPPELTATDQDAHADLTDWNSYVNPNAKSGKLDFLIRSVSININQICNLKCSYCAAGGDGSYGEKTNQISIEKTLPQLHFFMSKLKPGSKFGISLVGGEPLLHPETIRELYNYVNEFGLKNDITPRIKIVTNGTLLSGETLRIIRGMKLELTISFDGVKEKNDLLRPSRDGKSTTDKIVAGLKALAEDRGELTAINFSSITSGQNDDIFENYLYLKTFKPDSYEFVFANEEKSKEIQTKHIEGLRKIMAAAWAEGGETELRKIKSIDHYFAMLDSQQRTENHCGAGKSYLMVDAKNRLYSCVWDANHKQEVVGQGNQLDMHKLGKLSKSLIDLNNCQTCWARHLCGGGCMYIHRAHTGDKHIKSEMFCERTRSLLLSTIMYYKLARTAQELT